jgi:hypothetical protein
MAQQFKEKSPFDAIDQILHDSSKKPPSTLLTLANDLGLRVTSGFSSGGHNTGSMHYHGSKQDPGAIDVDNRNVTPQQLDSIRSQGYRVLDETTRPAGQAVWTGPHYHIDKKGGSGAQPKAQPVIASTPTPQSKPIDLGRPLGQVVSYNDQGQLVPNAEKPNAIEAAIPKFQEPVVSVPIAQAPVQPTKKLGKFETDPFANIDKLLSDSQPKAQQPVQQPQGAGFDLGKVLHDTADSVIGGIKTQYANSPINAKDPGDFLYKSLVSQNPMVQAGAGALSETANFANGITDLAGLGKPIPTGGLNDFTAQAPVFSTAGRALPYIVGEGAALKAGEKLAPGVVQAITSSPVGRTLAGAGVNAAEGYLVDPGEAGQQGRITNALGGLAIGGLAHGVGEVAGKFAKKAPIELAPEAPVKSELTQQLEQPLKPAELNPIESTANPQELTQSFKQRGGDLGQPSRNIDAQIVDAAGNPIESKQSGINKTPYQIALERTREPIDLGRPATVESASAPVGRAETPGGQFKPDLSPARQSADVLFGKQADIDAATQLRDDAINRLRTAENQLVNAAGVEDVAEAQRAIGSRINKLESKASTQALTPIEREDLAYNRALFDEVMNARKDALDAGPLVDEASAVTPRSSIETPEPVIPKEPVSRTVEPPFQQPKRPIDLAAPSAKNALPDEALSPKPQDVTPTLTDSQGRPLSRDLGAMEAPRETPRILDATGEPITRDLGQPVSRDLGAAEPVSAKNAQTEPTGKESLQVQPERNTAKTTTGKEVFTQGRDVADVQRLVEQVEKAKAGTQFINYEDAQKLLQDKQKAGLLDGESAQKQLDTLQMFIEAGRTGKTFNAMRREIQEGLGTISEQLGKESVKTRDDLNPFAVTVRQRKPSTEVGNLIKQLGSPDAALNKMREVASQFGITPTTKGKTIKAIATNIGKQIAEHPQGRHYFSDVYLNAHNFKTGGVRSAFDAPRGYPLRTFEQASIGQNPSIIPTGSVNQNAIAQQFQALKDISSSSMVSPELKQRVDRMLQKPYPSRKDITDVRKLLQDPKTLEQFCDIFGHGRS